MLLFMDGMAHYDTPIIARKWTTLDAVGATWGIANEGRTNNCLKRVGLDNNHLPAVGITPLMTQAGPWTPTNSGVTGFALKIDALSAVEGTQAGTWNMSPAPASAVLVMESGLPIVTFAIAADGTFYVESMFNSFGGFVLRAVSIEGLLSATWMYVECKWRLAVDGYLIVRVNGVVILNFVGDTRPDLRFTGHTWAGTWNTVRYLGFKSAAASSVIARMCDLYLCDLEGSGDDLRDFLGDVTIDYIKPNGIGASSGWTPSAGNNWECVDEVPPNDDVDYVSATPPTTRDTYQFTDLPPGFQPLGFQTCIYARKETPGAAEIQPVFRQAGVDYDGPAQGVASDTDYYYVLQPYDVNPATGVRATEVEIDAAEFGQVKAV